MMADGDDVEPGMDLEIKSPGDSVGVNHDDSRGFLNIVNGFAGGSWHGSACHRRRSQSCLKKLWMEKETDLGLRLSRLALMEGMAIGRCIH